MPNKNDKTSVWDKFWGASKPSGMKRAEGSAGERTDYNMKRKKKKKKKSIAQQINWPGAD